MNKFFKYNIVLFFLLGVMQSQEAGMIFSNKSSIVLSTSLYNDFSKNNDNEGGIYQQVKLDYKLKSPVEIWISFLKKNDTDISYCSLGFSYLLKGKKWDLGLFLENNFYEDDENNDSVSTLHNNYMKYGWSINFKKELPFYFKYTNSYREVYTHNDTALLINKKTDFLSIGSFLNLDKIILTYGIIFPVKDVLMLDFNSGMIEVLVGYKFLQNSK